MLPLEKHPEDMEVRWSLKKDNLKTDLFEVINVL
jgi:hypothetical protein